MILGKHATLVFGDGAVISGTVSAHLINPDVEISDERFGTPG